MKTKTLGKFHGGNPTYSSARSYAWQRILSCGGFITSKTLRVLASIAGGILFAGCELDAAETDQTAVNTNAIVAASVATNAAPTTIAVLNTNSASATNVAMTVSTNLVNTNQVETTAGTNAPGSTNIVANQEITILNEIPPASPTDLNLSWSAEQVVKLAQSGLSDPVLLSYVQKSTNAFNLDAEDILYLNDIGVSEEVIAAMLNHDGADPSLAIAPKKEPAVEEVAPPAGEPTPGPVVGQQQLSNLGGAVPGESLQSQTEVLTNYVPNGAVVGNVPVEVQPQPQQQVVVQQQPIIVQQQPQVVVAEPAVTYSTFYSSLSPYGSWLYVADYGWCWQPTVAVSHSGWRPYLHNGRWVYSNHGWYWHSDYSWGWAPFHYGRWHHPRGRGWVWVPDHTWGPSWVTWRVGRDYCGWAPLPPRSRFVHGVGFSYHDRHVSSGFSFGLSYHHYNFVPTRRFADRRLHRHAVPAQQTVNIYKDSTVVNNYIQGNNNTVVNAGISRDHIQSVTKTEIQKVNVRETPAHPRLVQPDRIRREGNDLVVYRPTSIDRPGNQAGATTGAASRLSQEGSRGANSPGGASSGAGISAGTHPRFQQGSTVGSATRNEPGRGELPTHPRAVSPRGAVSLGATVPGTTPMVRGGTRGDASAIVTPAAPSGNTASSIPSKQGQELQRNGTATAAGTPLDRQSVSRRGGVPIVQGQNPTRLTTPDASVAAPARGNTPSATTRGSATTAIQSHPRFSNNAGTGSGLVSTSPSGRPEAVAGSTANSAPVARPSAPTSGSSPRFSAPTRSVEPARSEAVSRQSVAPSASAQVPTRLQNWQNYQAQQSRGNVANSPNFAPQNTVPSVGSRRVEPARSESFAAPSSTPSTPARLQAWQQHQAANQSYSRVEPSRSAPVQSAPVQNYTRPQPGYSAPSAPSYNGGVHPRVQAYQQQRSAPAPSPSYQAPVQRAVPSAPIQNHPRFSNPAPAPSVQSHPRFNGGGASSPSPVQNHPRFSGGGRGEERGR